jgi:hypothetical protein
MEVMVVSSVLRSSRTIMADESKSRKLLVELRQMSRLCFVRDLAAVSFYIEKSPGHYKVKPCTGR